MIPCCAACRYFEIAQQGAKQGICYRYPPIQLLARGVPRFPIVSTSDWCGEFMAVDLQKGL